MVRLFFLFALLYFGYRLLRYLLSHRGATSKPPSVEDAEYEELS